MDARNNYRNFPLSNVDNRRFVPRWFNRIVKLRTGFLLRWSFAWVPGSWDGKKHPNEIWPDQPFRTMHLQHRFSDSPSFGSQFLQRNPSRYLWPVRYLEKKTPQRNQRAEHGKTPSSPKSLSKPRLQNKLSQGANVGSNMKMSKYMGSILLLPAGSTSVFKGHNYRLLSLFGVSNSKTA